MIEHLPKQLSFSKLFFSIVIMLAFLPASLLAQDRVITGRVTDANRNPLSNVSVFIKGTTIGATTASDGSYSITAPASAREIEFTIMGFEPQTLTIGNNRSVSPVMAAAGSKVMEEVVVTGISRVKKSQFAGAGSKIIAKEIENKPVASFDQLLQGRAPGVLALTGSGQPGEPAAVIIRGQNSISGGSTPLYIVDGMPVEAGVFQGMNPNDFASVDVLRDATTQALYGNRGSAGVIVVTTKRGAAGRFKVGYNVQMGVKSKPDYALTPMTTAQLLQAQHDYGSIVKGAANDDEQIPGWYYSPDNPRYAALSPAEQANANRSLDSISQINTNWFNEFFRRGTFSNHEISFSGGTDRTRFYSNLAYFKEEGIVNPSDLKRVTLRNNLDFADDKFTLAVSSNIGYTKRNYDPNFPGFIFNSFLVPAIQAPYVKPRNFDGTYAAGSTTTDIGASRYTAGQFLDIKSKDKTYNDQAKIAIGINLAYKLSPYLTAAINASTDFRETQNSAYNNRDAFIRQPGPDQSPTTVAGSQTEDLTRFITTDVRPTLTFQKIIREKHDLEVMALGEFLQEHTKVLSLTGYGIDPRTPNTPGVITQGNAGNDLFAVVGGGKATTSLASGLLMARYTLNGKYTLTGSYRRDGSSYLPEDNRWTGFYSVGGIWDIGKEKFVDNVRFLNTLRLKATYGGSGNANNFPRNYFYQATYQNGSYAGLPTQVVGEPGNPNAKWETTYTLNIGLDFEMFNRRLYGDLNVYDKRTKDLYVDRQLSAEAGGFTIPVNAGELQNKGFEWNVNIDLLRKKDATITLFATGSYNKNKLLSIGGETPYGFGTSFLEVGLPLGSHYTVAWAGVDAATGAPLYYDKNGVLTTDNSTDNSVARFGTWEAPWKGGFGTNLRYKAIELSVLFSWQRGAVKSDNLEYFMENPVGFLATGYNQSSDLNFWKKPGDNATTPSPNYPVSFSSKLLHDASFMRLRDLTLSYTFPKSLLAGSKFLSNAKFFVQGSNLFIWTKWRGYDPEAGAVNINLGEYPNPRAVTAGLNFTF